MVAGAVLMVLVSCAGSPEIGGETVSDEAISAETSVSNEVAAAGPDFVWVIESETVMSPDGIIDSYSEYKYNKSGNLVEIAENDGRNKPLYLRTYKYEGSLLVSRSMSDRFGILTLTVYESDSDGQIIREIKQGSEGETLSFVTFEYTDGLVSSSIAADGQGVPYLSAEYSYEGTTVVELKYILPGGKEEARFIRTLDSGKTVEEKTFLPDGTVETARKYFYEGESLVTKEYYSGSSKIKTVRYDYDSEGNPVRETWTNQNGREYEIVERSWIELKVEA